MGIPAGMGIVEERPDGATFRTTNWTLILQASQVDSALAREAFAALYTQYWVPLYVYVRRRGHPPEEAEDVTQDFLVMLMTSESLRGLRQEGGRFRAYLAQSLSHYLCNRWKKGRSKKRGGGIVRVPMDLHEIESTLVPEGMVPEDPLRSFERRWVETLLDAVMKRLAGHYDAKGKSALFQAVRPYLLKDPDNAQYGQAAGPLGLSEGAFRVAVHRVRHLYGRLLREEVARTVGRPDEVEDELRYLLGIVSARNGHMEAPL